MFVSSGGNINKMFIKKDDLVLVITGNDKGKTGKVLARKENRIVIEGVNIRKRHLKSGKNSQIVSIERPIHISNVCICSDDGKKLKLKLVEDKGTKKLVYTDEKGKTAVFRTIKKRS